MRREERNKNLAVKAEWSQKGPRHKGMKKDGGE